ncbi:MAG: hypothetical protein FWG98_11770 [Candidatus Cloacimonetes bacterium]|nr:hypothetical protein [Candidatus Cloacimonadota bacterium]
MRKQVVIFFLFCFIMITSCSNKTSTDSDIPINYEIEFDAQIFYNVISGMGDDYRADWVLTANPRFPKNLDKKILSIYFDGKLMKLDHFYQSSVWVFLPYLSPGDTHQLKIHTTNSVSNFVFTVPYRIENINFPEKYNFTQPFTLNWSMKSDNSELFVARYLFTRCENEKQFTYPWLHTKNCCEYSLVTILPGFERNYTFQSLDIPENFIDNYSNYGLSRLEVATINHYTSKNIGLIIYNYHETKRRYYHYHQEDIEDW